MVVFSGAVYVILYILARKIFKIQHISNKIFTSASKMLVITLGIKHMKHLVEFRPWKCLLKLDMSSTEYGGETNSLNSNHGKSFRKWMCNQLYMLKRQIL